MQVHWQLHLAGELLDIQGCKELLRLYGSCRSACRARACAARQAECVLLLSICMCRGLTVRFVHHHASCSVDSVVIDCLEIHTEAAA